MSQEEAYRANKAINELEYNLTIYFFDRIKLQSTQKEVATLRYINAMRNEIYKSLVKMCEYYVETDSQYIVDYPKGIDIQKNMDNLEIINITICSDNDRDIRNFIASLRYFAQLIREYELALFEPNIFISAIQDMSDFLNKN